MLKMFLCKPSCSRPEPPFFVAPSEARGSLGAYTPWKDFTMRRPERSEGCTAYARQDKVGGLFEEPHCGLDFLITMLKI